MKVLQKVKFQLLKVFKSSLNLYRAPQYSHLHLFSDLQTVHPVVLRNFINYLCNATQLKVHLRALISKESIIHDNALLILNLANLSLSFSLHNLCHLLKSRSRCEYCEFLNDSIIFKAY